MDKKAKEETKETVETFPHIADAELFAEGFYESLLMHSLMKYGETEGGDQNKEMDMIAEMLLGKDVGIYA